MPEKKLHSEARVNAQMEKNQYVNDIGNWFAIVGNAPTEQYKKPKWNQVQIILDYEGFCLSQ